MFLNSYSISTIIKIYYYFPFWYILLWGKGKFNIENINRTNVTYIHICTCTHIYTHTKKTIQNYYYGMPGPYIRSTVLLESFPFPSDWVIHVLCSSSIVGVQVSLRAQPGGLCLWTHIAAFVVVGPVRKDERGHREGTITLVCGLSEVQAAGDDAIVVSWDRNRAAFHIPEPGKSVKLQDTSECSLKTCLPMTTPYWPTLNKHDVLSLPGIVSLSLPGGNRKVFQENTLAALKSWRQSTVTRIMA